MKEWMDADQEACKWNANIRTRGLSAYRALLLPHQLLKHTSGLVQDSNSSA